MKAVQDKIENTSAGLDIGFLAAEFPSQSDIENCVTRSHVDFPLTLPEDGKNPNISKRYTEVQKH